MQAGFYASRLTGISPVTQQVKINTIAAQPAAQTASPPSTVPVKALDFNQALVSHALFNLDKNGPVVSGGAVPFYNDRFDPNKKWFFPEFNFQTPLQNSFLFTCWTDRKDQNLNPIYSGEAMFTLQKSTPAEIAIQKQNNPDASFNEIPLNNLSFGFTVSTDPEPLSFPCSFVQDPQDQNSFRLTIRLDQQDGLIRFYKAISNPANASICSITINASYFAYTPKPAPVKWQMYRQAFVQNHAETFQATNSDMVTSGMRNRVIWLGRPPETAANSDDTDNYLTNDAMPFVKSIIDVNFDCHQFPNNYLTKAADNSTSIFACKPPFGDSSLARNDYNKVDIRDHLLAATGVSAVYLNVYNGNYLVIPQQYQIALDETDGNTLIPAAYLFTKIDANNISNSVATFKFHIAPALTGFQLLLLKKLLLQNVPVSLKKTLDDIFVEFPTKIYQPESVQFNKDQIPNIEIDMMGAYAHGVEGCNFLSLEFQNVSIGNGNAAFIATMLKRPGGGMTENIVFDVDSDTDANPQATIVLSLEDITGNGMAIRQATDNVVYLINKTLFTISVSRLADKNDDPKTLDPAVTIPPNQAVSTNAISDVTEVPFTEFEYNYQVAPDYRDKILNEVRTDAGQVVNDDVIVTNNTGLFALYHIDHIDFVLAIVNPDEGDPTKAVLYTTNVISLATDGAVTFIPFVLPVASYLSKWSIAYSSVIHFADNSVQQNDPQHIEDINSVGKLINLTVSNLNLQSPRPPTQTATTP